MENWQTELIGNLMEVTSVKRVHESDWTKNGVPFYRAREIVALHNKEKITPLHISEKLYQEYTKISGRIKENDLLVTGVGTIGVPYLVKNNDRFYFKDGNIIWLKNNNKIHGKFLFYMFDSKYVQNQIFSTSGKGTVGTYTIGSAKNTSIMFPVNIKEQKVIADVISNIDNLIDAIQNLIEKKEKIKNEVTNELMSGKTRLHGYKEEFITTNLYKNGFTFNGLSGLNSSNFGSGDKKYITFLNILRNPILKYDKFEKVKFDNVQNNVKKGDLFFNTSSEIPEEVAMCSTLDKDVDNLYLNSFCFGYRLTNKNINNIFLSYYFRSAVGRNITKNIAQGSTRFNLPKKQFLNYEISIPNSYKEQEEIANLLINMDNEINILKEKLEKYNQIKKGAMEDLLTGKVKLNYE